MKTILMIATMITAATVWAMPNVGDSALYNVKLTEGTTTNDYTFEQTITSQETNGNFNITQTVAFNGIVDSTITQISPDQMASTDMIDLYLANCALAEGKLETITVPAGTFNTCAVKDELNATTWIAHVPFGMVRMEGPTSDGTYRVIELQSYVNGK